MGRLVATKRPNETEEWIVGKIDQWVETYKKSMLTPAILSIVSSQERITISDIAMALENRTSWRVTERGLYRTIQRLEHSGFLVAQEVPGVKTGKKKKEISLTPAGVAFLRGVSENIISL